MRGARALRAATLAVTLLLLGQFAVGMVTNLFVTVPAHHPGAHAANYFSGVGTVVSWAISQATPALAAHAALGVTLVAAALVVLGLSIPTRRAATVASAVVGLLAIIGAGFNGASFLNYGHNVSSLIMALLFAVAVLAYATVLHALAGWPIRDQRPTP